MNIGIPWYCECKEGCKSEHIETKQMDKDMNKRFENALYHKTRLILTICPNHANYSHNECYIRRDDYIIIYDEATV
jgi:hypothetical protein